MAGLYMKAPDFPRLAQANQKCVPERGGRMKNLTRFSASILISLTLHSCSNDNSKSNKSTESGIFENFKYPERYAKIVEAAEHGDKNSINELKQYYSNFPHTDLRNLEYWSMKSAEFGGRNELTNLIIALSLHQKCERAWEILTENYKNPDDFSFYESDGISETLDGKCSRSLGI